MRQRPDAEFHKGYSIVCNSCQHINFVVCLGERHPIQPDILTVRASGAKCCCSRAPAASVATARRRCCIARRRRRSCGSRTRRRTCGVRACGVAQKSAAELRRSCAVLRQSCAHHLHRLLLGVKVVVEGAQHTVPCAALSSGLSSGPVRQQEWPTCERCSVESERRQNGLQRTPARNREERKHGRRNS